ncbi:hypothetical protein HDU93_004324 [Gonapodya sp. JEL0774]|nr:hypothetical protein HDU93_004324 [Gonapodya sp. JEL0774]
MSVSLPSSSGSKSKYLSLLTAADVDVAGPDVYETPDVEPRSRADSASKGGIGSRSSEFSSRRVNLYSGSVTELEQYAGESDEDEEYDGVHSAISRARLDVSRATHRFVAADKDGVGDPSGLAYVSAPRAGIGRRRIKVVDEVTGPDMEDETLETPTERLARLKAELYDLRVHLQSKAEPAKPSAADSSKGSSKPTAPSYSSLLANVSSLETQLDHVGGLVGSSQSNSDVIKGNRDARLERELVGRIKALQTLPQQVSTGTASNIRAASSDLTAATAPQPTSGTLTYELHYTPTTSRLTHLSRLAHLESRLSALEKLVGASDILLRDLPDAGLNTGTLPGVPGQPTVLATLARLDDLLTLVTSKPAMDALIPRVRRLVAELERATELTSRGGGGRDSSAAPGRGSQSSVPSSPIRTAQPTSPTMTASTLPGGTEDEDPQLSDPGVAARVAHLHSLLAPLSPMIPALPHLVSRLRALRGLHGEQARLAATVAALSESQKGVEGEVKRLTEVLGKVDVGMKETEERVKGNVEEVARRWEELIARWEKVKVVSK